MYWSRGLFLWMVQCKSRFRNLKRVHGTTQEFASGTFRSVNSKAAYWPNTSSQFMVAAALQMRRNWETDPLLCLKFSTWAGLKHLWDFITDTVTRSRFYRWVQNQTASGVFGANGSFELKQFNTTHCHIVRCQHRETRFWEFPTFQSSLAKARWWGSPKRALAWELESHYLSCVENLVWFSSNVMVFRQNLSPLFRETIFFFRGDEFHKNLFRELSRRTLPFDEGIASFH